MKKIIIGCMVLVVVLLSFLIYKKAKTQAPVEDPEKVKSEFKSLDGIVIDKDLNQITLQDKDNIIYTFFDQYMDVEIGDHLVLKYTGLLNKNTEIQGNSVSEYSRLNQVINDSGIPSEWDDNGIFRDYYKKAYQKLKTLSLEEKIGQVLLVRYPKDKQTEMVKKTNIAGFVFYEKDFKDKSEKEVKDMIDMLQNASKIPLLTAVDEEGGKVIRISSNPKLTDSKFQSSSELYHNGGMEAIKKDTLKKSSILKNLGLNLNLAPVVDVSTDPNAYIYSRTLGQDTTLTSEFAKTVIETSKNTGVSYTLKHFPGYGNNTDTHITQSIDNRTLDDLMKHDFPPFRTGIEAGAESVLVSHNTVNAIDSTNATSLSRSAHNLLRNELKFTGIIMTDDLDMGSVSSIPNKTVKALQAGNDLIITSDYEESIQEIKSALANHSMNESLIDHAAFRVLAWKYYKGLIFDNQK